MRWHLRDTILLIVALTAVGALVWEDTGLATEMPLQETGQDRGRLLRAHDNTSFPLEGRHRMVECGACHIDGVVGGTPATCEACHWSRRQDDPNRLQLGTHCADCHTPQNWGRILPGAWEHEAVTGFRLDGTHAILDCTECHISRNFRDVTAQCSQCHLEDFQRAENPNHLAAAFPTDCELCHFTATRWQGANFDHSFFPLTGRHRAVECLECHRDGQFAGASSDCISCHRADFERTTNPNHLEAGFSTDCAVCHGATAASWRGAAFDHDLVFPLTGMHRTLDCQDCHENGQLAGTSSECVACHRDDYERTTSPNHQQAGFPTDCAACHGASATTWSRGDFDHDRVFPLKGMHKTTDCRECHESGVFTGTPSDCFACHQSDYQTTTSPDHARAGFSTNCLACHNDSANTWLGASFDHDRVFALSGRHRAATCEQCHVNERFAGTPSDCIGCHQADYNRTSNPNHAASGFGTDCTLCHGEQANSWLGATFEHDQFFPLLGRHRVTDCVQCHVDGRYPGTPTSCIDCHRSDYDQTTNPNHAASGFSTDCVTCHGNQATSWLGASFDHNAFFPLLGRHQLADCAQCHVNGYPGTPTNCVDCHLTEYQGTTNPPHQQAGFGTDCASCHGNQANNWLGASFDHNDVFPLQGAHNNLDCQVCHSQGYNLPRDCFGCHTAEYNATQNPNHLAAGFPTNCESCHLPNHVSWTQAQFNHAFPIEKGPHAKFDCAECHRGATMLEFSCIDCHTHEKPKMDEKHKEVGGYLYNSQACYACHPNGKS